MVTLDWTASAHDGVTLVTVRLDDIDEPTRVHIASRLDGPVWPPRREGVPEAGWTDDGFDGVVGPGTAVLGYASPAPPAEPPAELVDTEPVPDADGRDELTADPESVVRRLGDPSPPADAVPTAEHRDRPTAAEPTADDSAPEPSSPEDTRSGSDASPTANTLERTDLPAAVGPWLAEMARRADRAERLHGAETVPEATAAVRAAGGMAGVRDLAEADDAAQLRALARRARRLADRREGAAIPVDTLTALA